MSSQHTPNGRAVFGIHRIALTTSFNYAVSRRDKDDNNGLLGRDTSWGALFTSGNTADLAVTADLEFLNAQLSSGVGGSVARTLELEMQSAGSDVTAKDVQIARVATIARKVWLKDTRKGGEKGVRRRCAGLPFVG